MSTNIQDPYSIREFEDLVAASFNLPSESGRTHRRRYRHHPYDPTSPPRLTLPHTIDPTTPPSPSSSYFEDSDSEQGDHSPFSSPTERNSTSLANRLLRHRRAQLYIKPRTSTFAAAKLFHTVRSRASAFVLRSPPDSRVTRPFTIDADASFIPTISSLPRSALSARPATRSSPSDDDPPPPTPPISRRAKTAPLPLGSRDLNAPRPSSPQSFLKLEPPTSRGTLASRFASIMHSRAASFSTSVLTTSSTAPIPSFIGLESFFDDSAYFDDADLMPPVPPYARSVTPFSVASRTSLAQLDTDEMEKESIKIHARLPPLRKTRSHAPGLLKRVGARMSKPRSTVALSRATSSSPSSHTAERADAGIVSMDIGIDPGSPVSGTGAFGMFGPDLWGERSEDGMAGEGAEVDTSFLFPREAPAPPLSSTTSHDMDEDANEGDDTMEVPAYVLGRRGSAATTVSRSFLFHFVNICCIWSIYAHSHYPIDKHTIYSKHLRPSS